MHSERQTKQSLSLSPQGMGRQDTIEVNSSAAVRKGTNFYHSASYLESMGAFKGMLRVAEEPETKPRTSMRDTERAMITEMGTLFLGFPGSSEKLSSQLSNQGWAHTGLLKAGSGIVSVG